MNELTKTNGTSWLKPQSLEEAMRVAEMLSKSALLPNALRGKPADVLVIILTGAEFGFSPMQSIRGINVISGKGVLGAGLTVAAVKGKPDCISFKLIESSDTIATYETERKGEGTTRLSFTIEQAKKAGLIGKDNWRLWPAAMLRARCSQHLARAVYPDYVEGIYGADELDEAFVPQPERLLNPEQTLIAESIDVKKIDALKAKILARAKGEAIPEPPPDLTEPPEQYDPDTGEVQESPAVDPWSATVALMNEHKMSLPEFAAVAKQVVAGKPKAHYTQEDVDRMRELILEAKLATPQGAKQ